jgi:hypothetical protein
MRFMNVLASRDTVRRGGGVGRGVVVRRGELVVGVGGEEWG